MPIDAKLVNCDLCILAYQNYHQAVIWPLDPWYEVLARGGSNRRTLFMKAVHGLASPSKLLKRTAIYAGPLQIRAGIGSSNAKLDPVITNYRQIDPKLPAFTGEHRGHHRSRGDAGFDPVRLCRGQARVLGPGQGQARR